MAGMHSPDRPELSHPPLSAVSCPPMQIALINTNRIRPPIAPIGLEYVAHALIASKHDVTILDLCWENNPDQAIATLFANRSFDLVGMTLRNTDDCAFTNRQSFLAEFGAMVLAVRARTAAVVVVGGVGFSIMPIEVLNACCADAGIIADGEFALVECAARIARNESWHDLPGLIVRRGDTWRRNPPSYSALNDLPAMTRDLIDNRRYFREGGQAGIETKRGCSGQCTYCPEPCSKGGAVRLRPATAVVDELEALVSQGIDHIHTCDSEFNLPISHAQAICAEIIRRGLGSRLRWYAYCAPAPFSAELARLMAAAGCAGINFGADSGDDAMLRRLKRAFTRGDIADAVSWCTAAGIAVMLDLLIGAPGESAQSITATINLMRRIKPDRVGVAVGVRIYPGTELDAMAQRGELRNGCSGGSGLDDPLFYLEPAIAEQCFSLLDRLIANDKRFFFFDPTRPDRNYNYNANQVLVDAIGRGERGAYWDILRRI
jgi:radical SAM superfamily enzyme YgiQ (UPF0313 family)